MKLSSLFTSCVTLCLALLFVPRTSTAEPMLPPLPPHVVAANPVDLLPADPRTGFVFRDNSPADKRASFVAIPDLNGKPTFQAKVLVGTKNASAVELNFPTSKAVKKGDVLLVRFAARSIFARQESGDASFGVFFQRRSPPWEKSISFGVSVGADWAVYSIPFVAGLDFEPGQAGIHFGLGGLEQTLEITSLELLNFGSSGLKVDQLPVTSFTYTGRDANAPWRDAALKRIEKLRTAPIAVTVKDAAGNVVPGAQVEVNMTRSAFLFGTEVGPDLIVEQSPNADVYRKILAEYFNTGVPGNHLKWPFWNSPERRKVAFAALDWLAANNLQVRGHNLVWPGMKFSPKIIRENANLSAAELNKLVEDHIRDEVTQLKGRVICWDVVNEPVHETDYFKIVPVESMVRWYQIARECDPNAYLVINEYGMLNGGSSPSMIAEFLKLTNHLRSLGAPIDALGVQGHIGQQPRAPVSVLSDLDLLATANMPIEITEFDINTPDEALQADYTRDFLICIYSHPSVTGFTMWGFYEGAHWKPQGAMFRKDWSEKPNAAAYRDLVLKQWHTRISASTPASGALNSTGHLGTYTATATLGDKTASTQFTLSKQGASLELVLK